MSGMLDFLYIKNMYVTFRPMPKEFMQYWLSWTPTRKFFFQSLKGKKLQTITTRAYGVIMTLTVFVYLLSHQKRWTEFLKCRFNVYCCSQNHLKRKSVIIHMVYFYPLMLNYLSQHCSIVLIGNNAVHYVKKMSYQSTSKRKRTGSGNV